MKKSYVFLLVATLVNSLSAITPTNLVYPYDSNLSGKNWEEQRLHINHTAAFGMTGSQAWDGEGNKVNNTQLWNADQNALAMAKGFTQGTEQANIAQNCNAIGGDDGVRGHFKVTGDFKVVFGYDFGIRYFLKKGFWLGAFTSFYKMKLENVAWADQTKNITADDVCTKTNITDNIFTNVNTLGSGLQLKNWNKEGFGDTVLMAGWQTTFLQRKQWIKKATPNIRFGVTLPTGVKKDEDKIMCMPFGNDGSVGIIIGAGLLLNYVDLVDAGVDVEFSHIFNNTRKRRIKVDVDQTDFLLLTKTDVQKDPGLMQKFNLFIEPKFKKVSVRAAYQHVKRSSDHYYVTSNDYSSKIANTAEMLKEWTTHNVMIQFKIDTADENSNRFRPQFSLFYKHPFNGRRSVQTKQFGLSIMFIF